MEPRKTLKIVGVVAGVVVAAALAVAWQSSVRAQTRERPLADLMATFAGEARVGLAIRDVNDADVRRAGLDGKAGAAVDEVRKNSPAERAGIRAGDVIVRFDAETVRSARHLSRLVDETPDAREVNIVVARGTERLTLTLTPESRPASSRWLRLDDLPALRPDSRSYALPDLTARDRAFGFIYGVDGGRRRLGVGVQDLSGQLAEYFGVEAGVLVTTVEDGTPARAAGLRAGDIITRVDDREVRTVAELQRRLAGAEGDVTLAIVRDRKSQTVKATLDRATAPRRIIRR